MFVRKFGVGLLKIGERWSEIFLIKRIIEQNVVKINFVLHVKYLLFFSYLKKNLTFFGRFSRKIEISNFMKIHPVGAELFHADEQTYKV